MGNPDCCTCQHRTAIPGGLLSECRHPAASVERSVALVTTGLGADTPQVSLVFDASPRRPALNITFQTLGIQGGDVVWPMVYDPEFLADCSGWSPKVALDEA